MRADIISAFLLCLGLLPAQATAQRGRDRVPVVQIVQMSEIEGHARAIVYFRPSAPGQATIAVERHVQPEDLAQAFSALAHVRTLARREGTTGGDDIMRATLAGARPKRALTAEERRAYGDYIAALARGRQADVPGVGNGRVVEVVMPEWK